jgi:predicted AAA+ superfamily ATPase
MPAHTMRRLWTMLAHTSGGLLNASRLAGGLGVSSPSVERYIDLLADLGLARRLLPWQTNTGKRLTKSPKVFLRDSGLLHTLLDLETIDDVLGHPVAGPSYESFVVENVIAATSDRYQPHFYRTAHGGEIDLVLVRGGQPRIAIEIKRSSAPWANPNLARLSEEIGADTTYLVHPDTGPAYTSGDITVIGVSELIRHLRTA